ncbi:hypothetical protein DICPUDRAFT_29739 [Dictyostelium purpureum]|uniref:Uncharacterized protein n=1 Tax=Dictyostelium purpureum TaxID=5786 RepID=F0ZE40_DICPU|nr:uncharacterized protein DICPUDRAFT_29739 [Dictyostelium purpureum]EGC37781.1 hypothetical protein DICPUDRAFT_29739 [Dictyostelium purpureum]|eukprot:XP_003285720.1 hypothetical protein DICPUDRAFT_29739 [Dictyostelium purpureum]
MSQFSKSLLSIFSSVRGKSDPIVFFSVGNFNSMSSRSSIAIKAMNHFAANLGLKWVDFPQNCSKISYSPENHLLLVKCDTYITKDNFEVLKRLITLMPNIKTDSFCAIHYEHLYKLGIVESVFGGRTRHNDGLLGITSVFQTEDYHRVPIGIANPIDDISFKMTPYSIDNVYQDTTKPFVVNRFPEVQLEMVDKVVVPYASKEMFNTISMIKKHLAQKSESGDDLSMFKTPRIDYSNFESHYNF